jgi:hypothetical protein
MRPVEPPNPDTRTPNLKAPPGACDTHLHVYGPFDRYPLVAERGYDPDPHSTLDDYLKVHFTLGLERAVIVTGSGNGTNNQITLDAIARMNSKFKGLALLDPAIGDAELLKLKDGGFTGFRIKSDGRGGMSFDETRRMVTRTAGFNWHVEFMSQSMVEVIGAVTFLSRLKIPYVFSIMSPMPNHSKMRLIENSTSCLEYLRTKSTPGSTFTASINYPKPAHPITPTWSMSSGQSFKRGRIMSSGAATGPTAACECPCPTMEICWIFCLRRRPMTRPANLFSLTIQPSFTAGPPPAPIETLSAE